MLSISCFTGGIAQTNGYLIEGGASSLVVDAPEGMAQWLESALRESTARWKIVIGHHPLWSSGGSKFEEAAMLRRLILPALCRYADAYFAGHDHSLEVHTDDCSTAGLRRGAAPLLQVVSGAAAKQRGVNRAFADWQARSYPQHEPLFARGMTWGFVHVTLGRDSGEVTFRPGPADEFRANEDRNIEAGVIELQVSAKNVVVDEDVTGSNVIREFRDDIAATRMDREREQGAEFVLFEQ